MKPFGASSAPPPDFVGPDTRERYVGLVLSVEKTSKMIPTSDTSGEKREFLEIQLKVQKHTTLEDMKSVEVAAPPEIKEIIQKVPPKMNVRFYFQPDEKFEVGDQLEVTTLSRRQISYGWVSGEHGATYRRLKRSSK